MPFGNATMLTTVKLAGTFQRIESGQRVKIELPANLPNDGRDQDGRKRYFATPEDGVGILVYRDEFQMDDHTFVPGDLVQMRIKDKPLGIVQKLSYSGVYYHVNDLYGNPITGLRLSTWNGKQMRLIAPCR